MRNSVSIIAFFIAAPLFSQWILKPIATDIKPSANRSADLSAVELPFWDDFSTSATTPGDLWEDSDGIFVNATLGVGAPSYNVATFDGVNAFGRVYAENDQYPGLTDQLMSRKINLDAFAFNNTVYMSFFWQMGGNGEHPDSSADSLRLQFQKADGTWHTVWKRQATQVTTTTEFAQSIVQVTADYRHANFRFKFESFGSQQGPFDTWHIDYVYLDEGRSATALTYKDRAFTGTLSSLIAPYQEMPAHHFFLDPDKYLALQHFQGKNLDNTPHTLVLAYELTNINTSESYSFTDPTNSFSIGQLKTINLVEKPNISAQIPPPDSVVFDLKITSNFNDALAPINYRLNDTLRARYTLHNYYAYDDGSAEFAAGVRQNGTVAMEFNIETRDTLTHVDIHFPAIIPSSESKVIEVKVWRNLEDEPVSSQTYTIRAGSRNEFQRIALNPAVVVTDKIFIGYTQRAADFVGVGLDRSNTDAFNKMYYRIVGEWEQNEELNGVLMMRAVFQAGASLVLNTTSPETIAWFPNPTSGQLTIKSQYTSMRVWALDGRLMHQEDHKDLHDLAFLDTGVYLLEVLLPDNTTQKFKLVKK